MLIRLERVGFAVLRGEAMQECIFCKIVAGKIPSQRVYEDDACVAFLDIAPVAKGHILLVPKAHVAGLVDACDSPAEFARAMEVLPRLVSSVISATGAEGCNVLINQGKVAGQVIEHLHVHVIPRWSGDVSLLNWHTGEYQPGEAETLAAEIASRIKSPRG